MAGSAGVSGRGSDGTDVRCPSFQARTKGVSEFGEPPPSSVRTRSTVGRSPRAAIALQAVATCSGSGGMVNLDNMRDHDIRYHIILWQVLFIQIILSVIES